MATSAQHQSRNAFRIQCALNEFRTSETRFQSDHADHIEREFGRSAIPVLIEDGLTSGDYRIRQGSIWTLFHKYRCPPSAKKELRRLLEDRYAKVRWYAAWAYGEYGPEAIDALSILIAMLKDRKPDNREQALKAITKIGPSAHRAVDPIIACMKANRLRRCMLLNQSDSIRCDGARALGSICAKPRKSVPMLEKILTHPYRHVRSNALEALAAFGESALPALDAMVLHLHTPNPEYSAGSNIAALGEKAFPKLIDGLNEGANLECTVRGLKKFGVKRSAAEILDRLARGEKYDLRIASKALHSLGEDAILLAVKRSASGVRLANVA